jgi:hypothetical protein
MDVQRGEEPHHDGVCLNQPVDETPDLQETNAMKLIHRQFLLQVDGRRGLPVNMATERSSSFKSHILQNLQPQRRSLLPDQNCTSPQSSHCNNYLGHRPNKPFRKPTLLLSENSGLKKNYIVLPSSAATNIQ